jgi:hypothetical protein
VWTLQVHPYFTAVAGDDLVGCFAVPPGAGRHENGSPEKSGTSFQDENVSEDGRAGNEETRQKPPQRKVVSGEQLLRILNARLEGYGHCHSCRFVGPIRGLEELTEDGRNWSNFIPLVCSDGIGSGCKRIADRILSDAALEYNLKAGSQEFSS